jgi:hypothetical protein
LIPILQNPSNNEAWPKVLSQDILRHAMGIKNKVHILNGQMKGLLIFTLFISPALDSFYGLLSNKQYRCFVKANEL